MILKCNKNLNIQNNKKMNKYCMYKKKKMKYIIRVMKVIKYIKNNKLNWKKIIIKNLESCKKNCLNVKQKYKNE